MPPLLVVALGLALLSHLRSKKLRAPRVRTNGTRAADLSGKCCYRVPGTARSVASQMERRFLTFVVASAAFMAIILLIDRDGLWPQLGLGAATAAFLWLFARESGVDWRQILCAIVVASTGEVVLSLGWGLYTYEHALIPLYVPPGHGLFYTLAAVSARQELLQRHASSITRGVIAIGSLIALVSLVLMSDTWGFLWWIGAVALIWQSRNRLLLSTCFVYTILLEWAGTAIGNWRWAAEVPFVGLHSANPPAGVGILYILLDLIAVSLTALLARRASTADMSLRWQDAAAEPVPVIVGNRKPEGTGGI